MRYFDRAMVLEYDLGFSIAGWGGTRGKLTPLDIADDGQTIIGTGLNPDRSRRKLDHSLR